MKRLALRILVASVALSALLGCWALLSGSFGKTQGQVLLTTLTVSGTSILAMACAPAWDRRSLRPLPQAGIALSIVTAALLLTAIWGEVEGITFWKTVGTLSILSVSASHASLVSLASLAPARRWLKGATLFLNAALAAGLILFIWTEPTSEWVWRIVGVASILLCSGTILVPVFQRMDRGSTSGAEASVRSSRPRFCVACGSSGVESDGEGVHTCSACGARFRAEVVST